MVYGTQDIVIFGRHVQNNMSRFFFLIFSKFWFCRLLVGYEWAKSDPKWQNIVSDGLNLLGTIHDMIIIYGTNV